MNNKNTTNK